MRFLSQPHYLRVFQAGILACVALLICILALSPAAKAQVSQLSASVDRNTVLLDESLQFTLVAAGTADRNSIDFSPLQTNFSVSQPSFSQSTQIINGNMSRTVTWTMTLYPKSVGSFTIESFTLDGITSNEFTVKVLPVNSATTQQPREFFVTAETDNTSVYLQQQILYTVKIHLARDIQRGQLTPPDLVGAIIEQIGEDKDYQEVIDGVRYRIIERKYAIIPQSSGDFIISGPLFEAEVPTNSRRSFANFGRSETIARRASDIDINVRPIPDNYTNTWLPSELVEITEQWQGTTEPFVVGEPVTRTITLTALGLTKEQLPDVELPYHPSFKVYPEQPTLATVEHSNKLIAQGVFNSAIIPEQAGTFVLPKATIPWFNVSTGKTEFATLPARSIEVVLPDTGSEQTPAMPPATQTSPANNAQPNSVPALTPPNEIASSRALNWLHYALIASNILTLLALYVMWLMKKDRHATSNPSNVATKEAPLSEQACFTHLQSALAKGDTHVIGSALEKWLKILHEQQFYSVSASLATYPSAHALEAYNQYLAGHFSDNPASVDYRDFAERLAQFRKLAKKDENNTTLSVLYPK